MQQVMDHWTRMQQLWLKLQTVQQVSRITPTFPNSEDIIEDSTNSRMMSHLFHFGNVLEGRSQAPRSLLNYWV
jgi:hypothetical protein